MHELHARHEGKSGMSYEEKLQAMGYTIEPVELDTGKFVQAVKTGNLVFTSGQVSRWGDEAIKGKVGADLTVEQGYEAAKLCALNCLRAIKTVTGSLDEIVRFVKVLGMVNVAPDFDATPAVINGCSELLREVFGEDAGYHARSAVGMTIPHGWAVEIEMVVEVK
jgi:enamine deaminase RidA (YjgF/YER057c/UK114 family)